MGDDVIAAPIVRPAMNSGMTQASVWIPPGQWYEVDTGVLHTGASDGSSILTKLVSTLCRHKNTKLITSFTVRSLRDPTVSALGCCHPAHPGAYWSVVCVCVFLLTFFLLIWFRSTT